MAADGRGRDASTPMELPAAGWRDISWRIYSEISDDRVMLVAAGVTYYLLLAMVPALSALVSVYGLFADPATIQSHMGVLSGVVPGGGMDIIKEQLSRLAQQGSATLGLTFAISLAFALWSANSGVKALFESMNVAYDEHEERGFVWLTLICFAFTLGAIVAAILFAAIIIVLPIVLGHLGLGRVADWTVRIGTYAVLALIVSFGVAALYRWGPCRSRPQWRWITPGVVLTVILTIAVSILFSWYVSNFGSYNATYGSLGAMIGFMTWIWLTANILIIGGELNSEMEHQTSVDTTVGPDSPMGERGALMADHVAVGSKDATRREDERKERRDDREQKRRRRVSLGKLAFAVPAAVILATMQRRSRRS
ncbi:YihY/virulence factor BrkB family protein [Pararhizobium mangrovi]|uniref:YihY/virulence factor BrkB family protein n=1 Tax=Pararhizobium mangrovi TaxID=2590452 RepID=A0A506UFP6_9HYPH|nr:YihY/virulence factor BrkB family protein [Pararhizobium mangrovi]TPW31924.1 YihY/virulence factor BrkB family protein [Pararhizobium mangrovi]